MSVAALRGHLGQHHLGRFLAVDQQGLPARWPQNALVCAAACSCCAKAMDMRLLTSRFEMDCRAYLPVFQASAKPFGKRRQAIQPSPRRRAAK